MAFVQIGGTGSSGLFGPCSSVYMVGIKGTGVCALAELLQRAGMNVTGSDVPEVFYTDAILKELGIPFTEGFDGSRITDGIDLVVHSAAYTSQNNEELAEAGRKAIPTASYPEALGAYSACFDSSGIAGVHGKTGTTAMCGTLVQALGLPAQVLAGSAVSAFNGRSTLSLGDKYFIAETCEYRRHFMAFHPGHIVLTSVESDHQDFFPDYKSIHDAFVEYCRLIPPGGQLIYCADDPGACSVAGVIEKENRGVTLVPYGFCAGGDYGITSYTVRDGEAAFRVNAFGNEQLILRIPGRHQAQNATAAIALAGILLKKENGSGWKAESRSAVKEALKNFAGCKRRAEIIGSAGGIVFMDDYAHHPTAIKTTLEGLRNFFPERRLVVSFMSHTFSRTAALLDGFAESLCTADVLFLHKIYASAREKFDGNISGMSIYEKIEKAGGENRIPVLHYVDEPLDAFGQLTGILKSGDLFVTLGAGNNWPLGVRLFEHYRDLENGGLP